MSDKKGQSLKKRKRKEVSEEKTEKATTVKSGHSSGGINQEKLFGYLGKLMVMLLLLYLD